MAGIFGGFFSGLRFPQNEAQKIFEKFGELSKKNLGQNPGQTFENSGNFRSSAAFLT